MSCECDPSANPESKSPSCCAGKGASGGLARCLPFVLIAAAAALYFRDILAARSRTAAANEVRKQVVGPFVGLAISHRVEGRTMPFMVPCPVGIATNLLSAIAVAEPTKFPKGEVEGEELELHLVQTNKTVTILLAALLDNDPDTLYVRTKTPAQTNAQGVATAWSLSLPVRVPNAGAIVGPILAHVKQEAAKLPPEADLVKASTNDTFRAALQAAMASAATSNAAAAPATPAAPVTPAP